MEELGEKGGARPVVRGAGELEVACMQCHRPLMSSPRRALGSPTRPPLRKGQGHRRRVHT
eukprot:1843485-Pyramimonas_sp.AAC.1